MGPNGSLPLVSGSGFGEMPAPGLAVTWVDDQPRQQSRPDLRKAHRRLTSERMTSRSGDLARRPWRSRLPVLRPPDQLPHCHHLPEQPAHVRHCRQRVSPRSFLGQVLPAIAADTVLAFLGSWAGGILPRTIPQASLSLPLPIFRRPRPPPGAVDLPSGDAIRVLHYCRYHLSYHSVCSGTA